MLFWDIVLKASIEMMCEFKINGYPIKKIGSQGQKKTFLIALKLGQFKFLVQHKNTKPILMLDDIFDKLDSERGGSFN